MCLAKTSSALAVKRLHALSLLASCKGLQFNVRLDDPSATVTFPESKIVLPRTETSSSKRFTDGSTTLAVSGKTVYFQRPDGTYRDGKMLVEADR